MYFICLKAWLFLIFYGSVYFLFDLFFRAVSHYIVENVLLLNITLLNIIC
jgi:hypothetical protein